MKDGYHIGLKLTSTQTVLGWLYLPFYFVLNRYLLTLLPFALSELWLNAVSFAVNFTVVLLLFGRFLTKSLRPFIQHFWRFIQSLILGFALYYITSLVLTKLLSLLTGPVPNFNDEALLGHLGQNKTVMLLCTLLAAPIVEEVLIRGVVFGSVHSVNRIAAYLVSILFFCAMHVWQFFGRADTVSVLLSALRYIPAAVALGWTYEKSGTIWGPIVLHTIVNAIACFAYALF